MSGTPPGIVAACATCEADEVHCHGTLIRHHDGSLECTSGAQCAAQPDEHLLDVSCDDGTLGCRCVDVG